jgi:predicted AlkP superfamily pyrophosphatase or phosphodiesterase
MRPAKSSVILLIILSFVLLSLHSTVRVHSQNPPLSPKVVVISIDAGADWLVDEFLARGVLPPDGAFAQMSRFGARAEAMLPINVASTSPSHSAMFTGAYPERTGIVANSFLVDGASITSNGSGFNTPLKAETIWSAAQRQGKRVICATAVAADTASPERTCTLTLSFGRIEIRPAVVEVRAAIPEQWKYGQEKFEHAKDLQLAGANPSPVTYKLKSGESIPVYILAVDRNFDGRENYNAIVLDFDKDLSNGFIARLAENQWASVVLPFSEQKLGSWIRVLKLDANLSQVKLYLGEASYNPGKPAEYAREIESQVGFWTGQPDNQSQSRGLISEQVWFEQNERLAQHIKKLTLYNLKRKDWDALFLYFPIVDDVTHRYLVRHPRQADYDAENGNRRIRYSAYVERAYQETDRILKELMEAAPPEANFLIISDHGMVPTHTTVLINNFLAQSGFTVTSDNQSEVRAVVDGAGAHLYVNIAGRQKNGLVSATKLNEYRERIKTACQNLRDPVSGEAIFQTVLLRSELPQIGLGQSERTGDVFVSARAGFSLSGRLLPEVPIFVPSSSREDIREQFAKNQATREFMELGGANETGVGVHGHLGTTREIHSIFFAYGPNVPPKALGVIQGVDVAPTIAALLGIKPPRDAQGHSAFQPTF